MGIYQTIAKHIKSKVGEIVVDPKTTIKRNNDLVEEIHQTFMTEVDKLLREAKISKSSDTIKQNLIEKTRKLQSLGFTKTKEIIEGEEEIKRLRVIERENSNKRSLIKAIDYFSSKYPQYKFITEESVKSICGKYGLIYSEVSNYIGTVPDENLAQMNAFKIDSEDVCYIKTNLSRGFSGLQLISHSQYVSENTRGISDSSYARLMSGGSFHNYQNNFSYNKAPLEIAAPISDFNLEDREIKDFKLSIKAKAPDPVVLQPVFYSNTKYYLIVTAWGKEAEDSLVVNEKLN